MKKAIIYVFSGTGNTRLLAERFKAYLTDYDTTIHDIRMENRAYTPFPLPEGFDLIGFGHPVHGFNAPKVMDDFCKLLPGVESKKAFMFKCSGEGLHFNAYASQRIIRILEKKGYQFATDRHFVMPYNMIFRHTPEMVKSEYLYADALVRLNAAQLQSGYCENVHKSRLAAWFVPLIRIEWIYAQVQGPSMRVDMKKCVKCQKCVKSCPLGNIRFDGKRFRFGTNCALCVCCSFGCPTKAISIGLLNGWRVNGSYKIQQTAADPAVPFPAFGEDLRGLRRWLFYKYYRTADAELLQAGISVLNR